jgi:hypothetical protein
MNFPHIKRHLSVAEITEQYQSGEYGSELLLQHSLKHLLETKEQMRFQAAAMAMQGLLASMGEARRETAADIAFASVLISDALIAELNKSTEESSSVPVPVEWKPWTAETVFFHQNWQQTVDAHNAEMERVTK